jgi:hypothetical protein
MNAFQNWLFEKQIGTSHQPSHSMESEGNRDSGREDPYQVSMMYRIGWRSAGKASVTVADLMVNRPSFCSSRRPHHKRWRIIHRLNRHRDNYESIRCMLDPQR